MPIDSGVHIGKRFCNVYGGEWDGGAKRVLGGLGPQTPARQWYCDSSDLNRYYLECAHGHRGPITLLCRRHFHQYDGKIEFCPRCNIPPNDHRCKVAIREVS